MTSGYGVPGETVVSGGKWAESRPVEQLLYYPKSGIT